MDVVKVSVFAVIALLTACATGPASTGPVVTHDAKPQADGSIAITVTATSERLTSSDGSISLKLTDLLEQAASGECGGRLFDLTQGEFVQPKIQHGRMVATLDGVVRCK